MKRAKEEEEEEEEEEIVQHDVLKHVLPNIQNLETFLMGVTKKPLVCVGDSAKYISMMRNGLIGMPAGKTFPTGKSAPKEKKKKKRNLFVF
jgi:hypothetical protein